MSQNRIYVVNELSSNVLFNVNMLHVIEICDCYLCFLGLDGKLSFGT